jgi:hypothetical protein
MARRPRSEHLQQANIQPVFLAKAVLHREIPPVSGRHLGLGQEEPGEALRPFAGLLAVVQPQLVDTTLAAVEPGNPGAQVYRLRQLIAQETLILVAGPLPLGPTGAVMLVVAAVKHHVGSQIQG